MMETWTTKSEGDEDEEEEEEEEDSEEDPSSAAQKDNNQVVVVLEEVEEGKSSNGRDTTTSVSSSSSSCNGVSSGNGEDSSSGNKPRRESRRVKEKRGKKTSESEWKCVYCSLSLSSKSEFYRHCSSQRHQQAITSDEGKSWKFRAPPRGLGSETYALCTSMALEGVCRAGDQCVEAHSKDELSEWCDRFDFRQKKAFKANKLLGKTFVDTVIEKLSNAPHPSSLLRQSLEGVSMSVDRELSLRLSNKDDSLEWTFHISTSKTLRHVALLSDENRLHFQIRSVKHQARSESREVLKTYVADSSQEWVHPLTPPFLGSCRDMEYKVRISFCTEFFGTFNQTLVFNFGEAVLLKRDLRVDVTPEDVDGSGEEDELSDVLIRGPERWDESNSTILDFTPPLNAPSEETKALYGKYPPPPAKFRPSTSLRDTRLTKSNYRGRMHELLFLEEAAQYEGVSQFNVVAKLDLFSRYFLSSTASTAKYARPGEIFGKMTLGANLNEDTSAGRLILTHCSTLLLSKFGDEGQRTAFVSVIEDSGRDTLYLRLSSAMVTRCGLKEDDVFEAEVQFQLNRLPLVEMHQAIERLPDLGLVFPDVEREVVVPWSTGRQWSEEFEGLNPKQKEALLAITAPADVALPPILIIGPYGTGKTFTLGQALKMLLVDHQHRVLVCTHSNSAADLYIKEYLHPYVTSSSGEDRRVLRVYYEARWVKTVHETVLRYCLLSERGFRSPTLAEVSAAHIVVATLSTSQVLAGLGLPKGHFTHVLIDEAAQAMECEALMALALASPATRVVLAGDHMQLSPEVFSRLARDKGLNKSLLERLYDTYPRLFPCKILLCENYRSALPIVQFTSDLFYEQKLLASGKQTTNHASWHPLTLFTARGEDVQEVNSTSFYNLAEVYEVAERVSQLVGSWPWAETGQEAIGVVTPYYDQVTRIRSELRRRNLFGVSVERVLNVQGKQFRAIFLSTVRTRKTCVHAQEDPEVDFGFLSNAKLLNTAITRAQSLVAVVGDPVALCSIGKCRKMWERFVEACNKGGSFFGLSYMALRTMLDNVEFKKTYVLNPYAPVFVPRYANKPPARRVGSYAANRLLFNPPYVPPIPPPPWLKYGPPPPNIPPPLLARPPHRRPFNRYEAPPPLIRGQNSDFLFFNDGVHFPPSATGGKPPLFRNPPPPSEELLSFALQLLPEDIDLATFLKSNQMQVAWYNHLQLNRGQREASFFKNFVIHLQGNPELGATLNKQLLCRKSLLGGDPPVTPPRNYPPPPSNNNTASSTMPPILAADLEAAFHSQTSESAHLSDSSSLLLPSAKSTDTFFSLSHRQQGGRKNSELDPTSLILSEILNPAEDLIFDSPPKKTPEAAKVPLYMRRPGLSNEAPVERRAWGESGPLLLPGLDSLLEPSKQQAPPLSYANALLRNKSAEEEACPLARIRSFGLNLEEDQEEERRLSRRENSFRLFDHKF